MMSDILQPLQPTGQIPVPREYLQKCEDDGSSECIHHGGSDVVVFGVFYNLRELSADQSRLTMILKNREGR